MPSKDSVIIIMFIIIICWVVLCCYSPEHGTCDIFSVLTVAPVFSVDTRGSMLQTLYARSAPPGSCPGLESL